MSGAPGAVLMTTPGLRHVRQSSVVAMGKPNSSTSVCGSEATSEGSLPCSASFTISALRLGYQGVDFRCPAAACALGVRAGGLGWASPWSRQPALPPVDTLGDRLNQLPRRRDVGNPRGALISLASTASSIGTSKAPDGDGGDQRRACRGDRAAQRVRTSATSGGRLSRASDTDLDLLGETRFSLCASRSAAFWRWAASVGQAASR